MIISHIVAAAENNTIGAKNALPWHIPQDLQYFKDKTKQHIVIMGRKTYESVLEITGKPLPNRLNIVITRQKDYQKQVPSDIIVTGTLKNALKRAKENIGKDWPEEVFICGGAEIYKQSLFMTNRIYLTRIHRKVEGDAFYPEVPSHFIETSRNSFTSPEPFCFIVYDQKLQENQ